MKNMANGRVKAKVTLEVDKDGKKVSNMEVLNAGLNILINQNKEVEKVTLTVEGKQKDDQNNPRNMNLQAELSFAW